MFVCTRVTSTSVFSMALSRISRSCKAGSPPLYEKLNVLYVVPVVSYDTATRYALQILPYRSIVLMSHPCDSIIYAACRGYGGASAWQLPATGGDPPLWVLLSCSWWWSYDCTRARARVALELGFAKCPRMLVTCPLT